MSARSGPMKITSPTLHATVLFTMCVFTAILAMSFTFKVEVVARGQGRIVPVSRVQVLQPEHPGSIKAIHAEDGQSVSKGETLIEFDPTHAIADLGTIRAERNRLRIETARIDGMVGALDLDPAAPDHLEHALALYAVPSELADHPFAEEQRQLLQAELNDLRASLAQVDAREAAGRRSEDVTKANIERVNAMIEIQSERLQASRQLLQQGTTSRSAFLNVHEAFTELERERNVHLRELELKVAERAALASERRRIVADLRRSLLDRKSRIDSRLATLFEEERAARHLVDSATLRAPVSGIIDQLRVFTVGGVAESGSELLRIVPTDGRMEVEATFSNQDIGFMEAGQQANIRLDSYPSERFGFVRGEVAGIAADSTQVSEGRWGYVVRIVPRRSFLEAGPDRFPLRPGMTATVDVTTDERRIISYFFAPIVRTVQDALGER